MQHIESLINRGIQYVRTRHPWIGYVIASLELVVTDQYKGQPVRTMATNGKHLFVNPGYATLLNPAELAAVLVHEAIHVINKHMCRREGRDPKRWNMACDHTVNYQVGQLAYTLPENCLEPISRKTSEQIYAEKYEQPEEPEQEEPEQEEQDDATDDASEDNSAPGEPGETGDSDDAESEPAEGADSAEGGDDTSDASSDADGDSEAADEQSGGIGNPVTDDDIDLFDYPLEDGQTMDDAEQEIESRLNQADIACSMAGDTLSPVESSLADRKTVDTELHWPTELEDYMLEHGGANFTMNPPHLQLMQSGIICNQLNPQGCGHVVLVVDASGSIDADKLDLAVTHLELFMSNIDYESLRLIVHSSYVEHDELFMRGEPIDTSCICGGGGTRFRPVYNLIDEGDAPDLVIHFTDMETTDMHDRPEPAYPIVWLVDGSGLDDANEWTDAARMRRHKFTPDYGHRINARQ